MTVSTSLPPTSSEPQAWRTCAERNHRANAPTYRSFRVVTTTWNHWRCCPEGKFIAVRPVSLRPYRQSATHSATSGCELPSEGKRPAPPSPCLVSEPNLRSCALSSEHVGWPLIAKPRDGFQLEAIFSSTRMNNCCACASDGNYVHLEYLGDPGVRTSRPI